ncbi:MAG: TetR family transcriptional regulator [Acidobacteriota bacterium]
MVITHRAAGDAQKRERRRAILDVALGLFRGHEFEEISMAEVARRAGLAKGTPYLYFGSKEALFLALLADQFDRWFDELDAGLGRLARASRASTPRQLAGLFTRTVDHHPLLARLIAIGHAILERNIDGATALGFKQALRVRLVRTGGLLERCLPHPKPKEGQRLLLWIYTLVVGIQNVAEPAPVIKRILGMPGMECFRLQFHDTFRQTLTALLQGLWWKANRRTR